VKKPARRLPKCPGAIPGGALWRDSLGRVHDLAKCSALGVSEAAGKFNRDAHWVRRKIEEGDLYPVLRVGSRVEVFDVALADYLTRAVLRTYSGDLRTVCPPGVPQKLSSS
jgi:hypothetical protein